MSNIFISNSETDVFTNNYLLNLALFDGNLVSGFYYIKNSKIYFSEESYFFLMASMRKMRMKIPMNFTLEYFENKINKIIFNKNLNNAGIEIRVFPDLENNTIHEVYEINDNFSFAINNEIKMDLIKEVYVNTSFLNNIYTHNPENVYAKVYAQENNLDDLIILNSNKKIARSIFGNIVLLKENRIIIVSENCGSLISPLLDQFLHFAKKHFQLNIDKTSINPFETQQADEILIISDKHGFNSVKKIRNKDFNNSKFTEIINLWKELL